MEYTINIRDRHSKLIASVVVDNNDKSSINEANKKLRKYEAFIKCSGRKYSQTRLYDRKNLFDYPMRNRKEHTLIR